MSLRLIEATFDGLLSPALKEKVAGKHSGTNEGQGSC